jgi:hypothetical protein
MRMEVSCLAPWLVRNQGLNARMRLIDIDIDIGIVPYQ